MPRIKIIHAEFLAARKQPVTQQPGPYSPHTPPYAPHTPPGPKSVTEKGNIKSQKITPITNVVSTGVTPITNIKIKKCPVGKELNIKTNRCINKCKPNYSRNSKFKCVKNKTQPTTSGISKSSLSKSYKNNKNNSVKKCPSTKELNIKTNRCINKCKPNYSRNSKFKCVKNKTNKINSILTTSPSNKQDKRTPNLFSHFKWVRSPGTPSSPSIERAAKAIALAESKAVKKQVITERPREQHRRVGRVAASLRSTMRRRPPINTNAASSRAARAQRVTKHSFSTGKYMEDEDEEGGIT